MPANPTFKASYPEWRTVIDALHQYAKHLEAIGPTIKEEDEDKWLLIYDDLERLDRIIPSFERQWQEYMDQIDATLAASVPVTNEICN